MFNKTNCSIAILTSFMAITASQADILYTASRIKEPDNSIYSDLTYRGNYFDLNNRRQLIMRAISGKNPKAPILSYLSIAEQWAEIDQSGLPPAAEGRIYKIPVDINNNGEVLGVAYTLDGRHSFVASFSKVRDHKKNLILKQTNRDVGKNIIGHAINDKGQVVGDYRRPDIIGVQHAFLDTYGMFTDLGTLDGGTYSIAYSVNNCGRVTGISDTVNHESHAFVINPYRKTKMQDLGTLGGHYSIGKSINTSGKITGDSTVVNNGVEYTHAFVTEKHALKDLGTLGGNNSSATKINANGQIVGTSEVSDGSYHAFTSIKGVMTDLNTLVNTKALIDPSSLDPATGLPLTVTLKNAISINDKGEILAEDYNSQTFLLTPVHTPKIGHKSQCEKYFSVDHDA